MSLGDWEIAKIIGTHLGFEDHGLLTIYIHLDYGGSGQAAGGYALGTRFTERNPEAGQVEQARALQRQIVGILDACGVDRWEKLVGRTILVQHNNIGVSAFKPLPTESGREFRFALPERD